MMLGGGGMVFMRSGRGVLSAARGIGSRVTRRVGSGSSSSSSKAGPSTPLAGARRCFSQQGASASSSAASPYEGVSWEIRMLYDGDCPLCMREVNMLRRKDEGKNRIDFVDIASPDYREEDNQGISFEEAMGKIHAITSGGEVVTNVEVFRRLYDIVGLGWVFAITRVEPFGTIIDRVYDVWAKYRLPVTGREDLAVILSKRKAQAQACDREERCII